MSFMAENSCIVMDALMVKIEFRWVVEMYFVILWTVPFNFKPLDVEMISFLLTKVNNSILYWLIRNPEDYCMNSKHLFYFLPCDVSDSFAADRESFINNLALKTIY